MILLACGLLEPDEGGIYYDGIRLEERTFYELRGRISYVGPDSRLFRDSIRENICLGREFTTEEIRSALEKAQLTQLVQSRKSGLDGFDLPPRTSPPSKVRLGDHLK